MLEYMGWSVEFFILYVSMLVVSMIAYGVVVMWEKSWDRYWEDKDELSYDLVMFEIWKEVRIECKWVM